MAIELLAFAKDTGLTLFIRKANNITIDNESIETSSNISNTSILLYGLNQFARLNDAFLRHAESVHNLMIVWRTKGNILLIVSSKKNFLVKAENLEALVDLFLDAIQLTCGPNVFNVDDFDQQKRDLKFSFALLDCLLRAFASPNIDRITPFTFSINYVPSNKSKYLNTISSNLNRSESIKYWAIFVNGKISIAKKEWWTQLTTQSNDIFLISCLAASYSQSSLNHSKIFTIFLMNDKSNYTPTKLIISPLMKNVVLCIICSSNHSSLESSLEIIPINEPNKSPIHMLYQDGQPFSLLIENNLAENISAFIIFNTKYKLHFIYKSKLIEEYLDDIILLLDSDFQNQFSTTPTPNSMENICIRDEWTIYKTSFNKHHLLISALFSNVENKINSQIDIKSVIDQLINLFTQKFNKTFWP